VSNEIGGSEVGGAMVGIRSSLIWPLVRSVTPLGEWGGGKTNFNMQIISTISAGLMITAGFGKIYTRGRQSN
jgi:hypothetical protein